MTHRLPLALALALSGAALLCLTGPSVRPAHAQAADAVVIENNIEYSNPAETHLQLNMARPAGEGPFPAVVCIHGGGFRAGTRDGYNGLIKKLAERGYVAVTVSYRLAPKHPFPAAVHDVKAAVRFLRANAKRFRLNPDRIGVTGGSAGGTLAHMLGVTEGVKSLEGPGPHLEHSSKVQCVVNYFGATDFTKSYGKSVDAHEVLPLYLGGNVEQARQAHINSSPLYWVTPLAAPTLLIHGTQDNYVHVEQAEWIYDRFKAAGVETEFIRLEGAGHGFKGADAEKAEAALFAYFDKHLKR